MSKQKHTPGPWWCSSRTHGTIYIEAKAAVNKRMLQEICAVGPTEYGIEQQEANARLVSAAPQLLVELKRLVELLDVTGMYDEEVLDPCRAAIAKATGGEP